MFNIDRYAYASKLHSTDPMEKLFFAALTMVVCLGADYIPVSIAVISVMAYTTVVVGKVPAKVFLKLMLIPMSFLILGVVTIALGASKNADMFAFSVHIKGYYIGVLSSGIYTAAGLFFKALGAVSCLYYLSLNTPIVDILSALRRLRCPELIIELMSLIYRFIFVLLETAMTMFTAQNARLGYYSLRGSYRSLGSLVSTLFIRAYKRSEDLYTSLEARGYEGKLNVLEEPYRKRKFDYAVYTAVNAGFVIIKLCFRWKTGGSI